MATASTPSSTVASPENLVELVTPPLRDDGNNNFRSRSPSSRFTSHPAPAASDAPSESSPGAQTRTSPKTRIREQSHVRDYEDFLTNVSAIATLGSSITFSLIVSKIQDPMEVTKKTGIDLSMVRILLAAPWLLFTVLLVVVFLVSGLVKKRLENSTELNTFLLVVFSMIFLLIAAASVYLSLVVAAYIEVLGWVGLGIFVFVAAAGQYWYLLSAVLGEKTSDQKRPHSNF